MKKLLLVFGMIVTAFIGSGTSLAFEWEEEKKADFNFILEGVKGITITDGYAPYESPDEKGQKLTDNTKAATTVFINEKVSADVRKLFGIKTSDPFKKSVAQVDSKVAQSTELIYEVQKKIKYTAPLNASGEETWTGCKQPSINRLDGYFGRETQDAFIAYTECYIKRFPKKKDDPDPIPVVDDGVEVEYVDSCETQIFGEGGSGGSFNLGDTFDAITGCQGARPRHLVGVDYVDEGGNRVNALGGDVKDVTYILQRVINIITTIVASIAVFFVVKSGFSMAMSIGNADDVEEAKKTLKMALGGLFVIIFAYIIVRTVISITYSAEEKKDSIAIEYQIEDKEQKV